MARYSDSEVILSKEKLLKSAFHLFREKGYNGVGLEEVARLAKLTKGTFYAHFDSKRDLFDAVILRTIEYRSRILAEIKNKDGKERAIAYVNWYLSEQHILNTQTGCLLPRLSGDLQDHLSEKFQTGSQYINDVVDFFMNCGISKDRSFYLTSVSTGALTLARALEKEQGLELAQKTKSIILNDINQLFNKPKKQPRRKK